MTAPFVIGSQEQLAGPAETFDVSAEPKAVRLAALAVQSMISEADLTPKPGLVDRRGSGCHVDLSLDLMHRSARSLGPCFREMAIAASGATPSQFLREQLAAIGREGERAMFATTDGVNTHKGAIWALGLLVAGASMCSDPADPAEIADLAGRVARHADSRAPDTITKGGQVVRAYRVAGARGEAQDGFPHVVRHGLPTLRASRARGVGEAFARLDALMAIMAELDDTCLLHRGGHEALDAAKSGAGRVLACGGSATVEGTAALHHLDRCLQDRNVSPGGSGDLLAATLFLDWIGDPSTAPAVENNKLGVNTSWKY